MRRLPVALLALAVAGVPVPTPLRAADLYVDATGGNDASDGLSWASAKATVLAALAQAVATPEPDVVSVAAGEYRGDIDMPADVMLQGGFAPGGASRDIAGFRTILRGDADGPVVTFHAGTDSSVLDGFVVTGGWSPRSDVLTTPTEDFVGGIAIMSASPTVRQCLVQGNVGLVGAVFATKSTALIEDCVVQSNVGTGVRSYLANIGLSRVVVRLNETIVGPSGDQLIGWCAGIEYRLDETAVAGTIADSCVVSGNRILGAPDGASALYLSTERSTSGRGRISNSVFSSPDLAAAFLVSEQVNLADVGVDFSNCLFSVSGETPEYVGWKAVNYGNGTAATFDGVTVAGCTMWCFHRLGGSTCCAPRYLDCRRSVLGTGNFPGSGRDTLIGADAQPGTNVIEADPLFVPGPYDDYYLSQSAAGQAATSLAVDGGPELASDLGLDTMWTRTDEVPDSGPVDWGFHRGAFLDSAGITPGGRPGGRPGVSAGGPWASEPVPTLLEIWRGTQPDALTAHGATVDLPWTDECCIIPDAFGRKLMFYDVPAATAPIHLLREASRQTVRIEY